MYAYKVTAFILESIWIEKQQFHQWLYEPSLLFVILFYYEVYLLIHYNLPAKTD